MRGESLLRRLSGRLVVSCQAEPGMPLDKPAHIAALARSVVMGGAAGVRIEGIANIRAVRGVVEEPIIGLVKTRRADTEVYITPTLEDAETAVTAGADIVAFDATLRPRPAGVAALCEAVRRAGRLSMADISTAEEGRRAMAAGADIVGTTLAGYTAQSRVGAGPDFALMAELKALAVPFVAEGRIGTPEEARQCLALGAAFVVVGGAITRPDAIARRFVETVSAG